MLLPAIALLLLAGCPLFPAQNDNLVRQLDSEIIALKVKLAYLESTGAGCGATAEPSPIYAELVQVFSGSDVVVEREGSATRVIIPMADLFSSATSIRIRSEAAMTMDLLATALNLHSDMLITVEGHADEQAVSSIKKAYPTAWEFAAIRAVAVARELTDKYKVAPARITVASRGSAAPVAENDTPEGRSDNRRIVLTLRPPAVPKSTSPTSTP